MQSCKFSAHRCTDVLKMSWMIQILFPLMENIYSCKMMDSALFKIALAELNVRSVQTCISMSFMEYSNNLKNSTDGIIKWKLTYV